MTLSESGWSKQLCLWGVRGTEDKYSFQPERTQAMPRDMPLSLVLRQGSGTPGLTEKLWRLLTLGELTGLW